MTLSALFQYEMYTIERNAERTATAGRLLYDMFVNFPDQPVVWREISIITSALRNDSQDKQTQFLRSLFETLPGRVQCEMLLKVTEQCFNTLERSEMLLLLLRRFPETVVQHGVGLGEALLEAETIEEQESPVNCFRKLFVCDVLPLIINNHDVRLPANLLYKYLNKAAEFYINYVTRSTQLENQHQGRCKHPTPLLRLALLKSFRSPTPPIVSLCASLVVSLKDASRKKVYNNKS